MGATVQWRLRCSSKNALGWGRGISDPEKGIAE